MEAELVPKSAGRSFGIGGVFGFHQLIQATASITIEVMNTPNEIQNVRTSMQWDLCAWAAILARNTASAWLNSEGL